MLHTLAGAAWHGEVWAPRAELSLFVVSLFWTCWERGKGEIALIVRTGIKFFLKIWYVTGIYDIQENVKISCRVGQLKLQWCVCQWRRLTGFLCESSCVCNRSSRRSKGRWGKELKKWATPTDRILTRLLESESAECWVRVLEPGVCKQSSCMPVCAGEQDFVSNVASERDLRNTCFFF